ncbi:9454_t:CDS:2 [Entrophospora sp. SA101]|nr:9454_t:CDS:2 [Entrophospora sp. SA101]CAJ0853369.1 13812_t:CDS:2 [Entrophospora sp. SA101]
MSNVNTNGKDEVPYRPVDNYVLVKAFLKHEQCECKINELG